MRTDLKLNYGKLREVRGEISEYRQSLERVDNGLENLKRFLAGQESEAVDKLNKKLSDVTINIRDKIETLQLLEETLEDYVDDMERLVKAEGGGITRVDTWDISFNLSQIHAAVRDSFLPMTRSVNGMPHFSLIEDEEEKEKKKKRERNYNRLERFRSSDIMSLKRRVERHLEDLQDIYKNYLKPYEKLDDTYRSRLNKIYSSHTSAGDKWANFWDGFASVADSFITAFAIAAVTAFIAAITPAWLAVAGVVLLGVGVAVMANIPEESVPDWLKPVKKGADGIADKAVKMLKEGPASVVEDIGQGLMDEIQTPEGIASVAGGTVGTLAGGYAVSRVNSAPKIERTIETGGEYVNPLKGEEWHNYFNKIYGKDNVIWENAPIEDIIDMPSKITDFSPKQISNLAKKNGWSVEPLRKGGLKGIPYEQGGGLSIHEPNRKSIYIQYHPGGGHHGEMPYYKISSGPNGIVRYYINGERVKSWRKI